MFLSTVIPTIARPSLSRSVGSVLEQEFTAADYEVVVVNDSGRPLPAETWQQSERVRIVETDRRDKSVARNTGAALARGRYLHFLDDDDRLLPGALDSFYELASRSDAALLYGGSRLVDRRGQLLVELRHELGGNCFVQTIAGEWIPTGAYIVKADAFFGVGGYNPLLPAAEDIDLCRRIAFRGSFAGTTRFVLCAAMGQQGSSTDYHRLPVYSRGARELILDEKGAFKRMRRSARNSYWRGRTVRAYLTSAVWNLQHGRAFTALSRSLFGLGGLAVAGPHILSADFWRAVARPHQGIAFLRARQSADSRNQSITTDKEARSQ